MELTDILEKLLIKNSLVTAFLPVVEYSDLCLLLSFKIFYKGKAQWIFDRHTFRSFDGICRWSSYERAKAFLIFQSLPE